MLYYIPMKIVDYSMQRQQHSFIQPRQLKPGEIALFNKNGLRYQYFSNIRKLVNSYALIGEADALDPYFEKVIKPYETLVQT